VRIKILKLLVLFTFFVACDQNKKKNGELLGNPNKEQTKVPFDSTKINSFFVKFPNLKNAKNAVVSFYQDQGHTYVWFNGSQINNQSVVLQNKIQNISSEGLAEKIFYTNELTALLNSKTTTNPNVETELLLTAQYFLYAKKVWSGLSEKETKSINWRLPRKKLNYNKLLDSIIKGNPVLENPPVYRQYTLLKNELKKYQIIKQNGGFPLIDSKIINSKIGDSSASILNLQKWLLLSKDLATSKPSAIYDTSLQAAIKKFQNRFGLKIDGKITLLMLKELNVSVEDRILEIELNMERCRWLPTSNKMDYLVINIPEYKMHVYENNSLIWSMNAVVGKAEHETTIFADKIEHVVFSPYWNVPNSILQKEILPGIARNSNYLTENNMEWHNDNVRQKPGPKNSLGLVKFMFPNSYNIYLHDTPAKTLFNKNDRAFSHGCVRLKNAEKLANYLLKGSKKWTSENIKIAMNSGVEKYVKIQKNQAVFIVYFTSWVDNEGKLNFRKDIYKRDEKLAKLLSLK
jgi:murein L,D-transpeptidase YcbB/YkuD